MREGMRERNEMREKADCQDLQTHLEEGRRDCWKKGNEKKERNLD